MLPVILEAREIDGDERQRERLACATTADEISFFDRLSWWFRASLQRSMPP
jgi:hypothetical protein